MESYGNYFGKETGKLGFGLMRLPKCADNPAKIDIEQVKAMVDKFMAAGLTYFDTAYVYDGGNSEKAIKEALVDRYPRENYTLATKMNAALSSPTEEEVKREIDISLERTGAGYFDYYLLHAIQENNLALYDKFGLWDYVKELKAAGKIKHWGFSFHGSPKLLEELLTKHPDVEFIQLQINYADWEDASVASRENYEIARKHKVPFVIMEPIKGGALATPPQSVIDIFKQAEPQMSVASWAVRFGASLDGCITVLSGMSNMEQMEDNLSYMVDFKPLNDEEQKVIEKAKKALAEVEQIQCTACKYCMAGCPVEMKIPNIFRAMNKKLMNDTATAERIYQSATKDGAKASDCIACGQGEGACPQGLPIISLLERSAEALE